MLFAYVLSGSPMIGELCIVVSICTLGLIREETRAQGTQIDGETWDRALRRAGSQRAAAWIGTCAVGAIASALQMTAVSPFSPLRAGLVLAFVVAGAYGVSSLIPARGRASSGEAPLGAKRPARARRPRMSRGLEPADGLPSPGSQP